MADYLMEEIQMSDCEMGEIEMSSISQHLIPMEECCDSDTCEFTFLFKDEPFVKFGIRLTLNYCIFQKKCS